VASQTERWWVIETTAGSFAFHGTADAAARRAASLQAWSPVTKRYVLDAADRTLVRIAMEWAQAAAALGL